MALFENFPYTNMHELNLDWLIDQLNKISESSVLSVNGQTGVVVLYQDAQVVLPNVPEDNWSIVRMADGTHRGILFGNDNKAYIVHGNLMAELYANNNPPPYPVTKVNGLTGDIELYTDQYVRLPDLTDAQMTNWTFFRMINNTSHGIQFEDDGTAYIINGTSRYILYTSNNTPPYPVNSVNGQTGTIVLFTDTNGNMAMPAVTDPDYEGWSINRTVNGTNLGLEFKDDGSLVLKVGAAEYTVYTSNEPQANYVSTPSDSVQQIAVDSQDDYWGLIRETSEGLVGIKFTNTDPDDPSVSLVYTDSLDQQQTVQLLTVNDLPATGVYSVNTKTGIVTLYGSDLEMNLSDSRTIDDAIEDVKEILAVVENTNTAVHNISAGDYVLWNNSLYTCSNAIVIGDTLSLSNLTPANTTAFEQIKVVADRFSVSTPTSGITGVYARTMDPIIFLYTKNNECLLPTASSTGWHSIGTVNAGLRPVEYYKFEGSDNTTSDVLDIRLASNGVIEVYYGTANSGHYLNFSTMFIK